MRFYYVLFSMSTFFPVSLWLLVQHMSLLSLISIYFSSWTLFNFNYQFDNNLKDIYHIINKWVNSFQMLVKSSQATANIAIIPLSDRTVPQHSHKKTQITNRPTRVMFRWLRISCFSDIIDATAHTEWEREVWIYQQSENQSTENRMWT